MDIFSQEETWHKFLLEHQLEEIFVYKFTFDLENQWDQGTLEWKENGLKNILVRIDTFAHERKEECRSFSFDNPPLFF